MFLPSYLTFCMSDKTASVKTVIVCVYLELIIQYLIVLNTFFSVNKCLMFLVMAHKLHQGIKTELRLKIDFISSLKNVTTCR